MCSQSKTIERYCLGVYAAPLVPQTHQVKFYRVILSIFGLELLTVAETMNKRSHVTDGMRIRSRQGNLLAVAYLRLFSFCSVGVCDKRLRGQQMRVLWRWSNSVLPIIHHVWRNFQFTSKYTLYASSHFRYQWVWISAAKMHANDIAARINGIVQRRTKFTGKMKRPGALWRSAKQIIKRPCPMLLG